MAATSFHQETLDWQRNREAALKADEGWLTVAGLFWLKPGVNRFEQIHAPVEFHYEGGKVRARYQNAWREMAPDIPGPATMLKHANLTMFVIFRDGRHAIRLRDTGSRFRRNFRGITFYPPGENYRVTARWIPHAAPKQITLSTVIPDVRETFTAPGVAEFTLGGRTHRLEPVAEGDRLFYIFKDRTSGRTTYPAGRFLYSDMPSGGHVVLDFNRAYNPPCAYTPYATCPLPPRHNHLDTAIEAGEKNYHLEE
jgi:uncharacterized protein (DUF1684 family)